MTSNVHSFFAAMAVLASADSPAVTARAPEGGEYKPYACTAGPSQEVLRQVLPKVLAALSIMGSLYVLQHVWGKWRMRGTNVDPYHRIMAAYSAYDLLFTLFYYLLGSTLAPAETGWWGAVGNTGTCSLQGFFSTFGGTGSILCQVMLSLQTMLLVTYNWTPKNFEKKLEYRLYWFIFVSAMVAASIPLFFQGYNATCGSCMFYALPWWCGEGLYTNGTTECIRGSTTVATTYTLLLIIGIILSTLFCVGAMVAVYRSVYKQEVRDSQYSYNSNTKAKHSKSTSIRNTMLQYTSYYVLCWVTPVVLIHIPKAPYLLMVGHTLAPLSGFLIMLVFLRPRCVKYQREHGGVCLPVAYFHVMCEIPIEAVRNFFAGCPCWQGVPEIQDPLLVDDEKGFGGYKGEEGDSSFA